ncbi:Type 1 glutamine amidotransferase-like domain-containing protein [Embleya sp. NPDC020630]|uniref:Type 1 glutamine amidotransferase-like domain-containing protein n=1 Tax=Embleya sp. NPDC020630 TaxID=3363979 RepID=UPI0037B9FD65
MRMYLSSFRLGEHPDRLVALLGGVGGAGVAGMPIAVIANAIDDRPAEVRAACVGSEFVVLRELGLHPTEVDLRTFFDRPPGEVAAVLAGFPAVWVRGGNVFLLRDALARSGADGVLVDLLRRDAVVYGGYSAGACVLAPDLRGLERCDDADAVTEVYGRPVRWDGLGVLDHAVVPHVDSPDHPESALLAGVVADYRARGVPHRTLRDGQVLLVDGERVAVV